MIKNLILIFASIIGLSVSASMYEQTEQLDRGIEIIEAGLGLNSFKNGFSEDNLNSLKRVQEHANEVYQNLKDQPIMNTSKGEFFKKRYKNFLNYLTVANTFNECLEGDEEKAVSMKILNTLEGDYKSVSLECKSFEGTDDSFDEFYRNVMATVDNTSNEEVYKEMADRSLNNYAKTFANLSYSFNEQGQLNTNEAITKLCNNKCSDEQVGKFSATFSKEVESLKEMGAPIYDVDTAYDQLKSKVDNINESIDVLNGEVNTRDRSLWWDAMDEGEEFGPKYQAYLSSFMQNVNEGPGLLLLTEVMKDRIGAPRLRDDYEKNDDDAYEFPKHTMPEKSDIDDAKKEVFSNLSKQFKSVLEKKNSRQSSGNYKQEDIENLIISNPIAAAQMLNDNPALAQKLCSPLSEIGSNQRSDQTIDKVALIGGAVLGIGLMATGVGALVGGWLLAGTAAAGTLATVGATAGVLGFSLGAVEGGYWTKRLIEHNHDVNVFESSVLAGSSDEDSYEEAAQSIQKFREARFDAILSLGFSAVESLAVVTEAGRLMRHFKNVDEIGELSAVEKQTAMNRLSDTFKRISDNPQLLRVMNKLKQAMGGEKFKNFLASLASLSNKARLSVLQNLAKISPSSLDGNVGQAIADALNKSIKNGDLTPEDAQKLADFYKERSLLSLDFEGGSFKRAVEGPVDLSDEIEELADYPVSTAQRTQIETDDDFNFYLSQLEGEDREFTLRYIQKARDLELPKEETLNRLKSTVGQCNL